MELCKGPFCFETILQRLFTGDSLTVNFEQCAPVGSTVRSYLAWLKDEGRPGARFEDNKLQWEWV